MKKPEISVVISALNEEKTVEKVLKRVSKVFDKHKLKGELLFLDNHSTDKTGELADKVAKKNKRIRVIHRRNRPNKDLGSSLKEGIKNAKGEYLIIMDCDLSHSPEEIPRMLKHKNEADIIVGSRYVSGGRSEMNLKRTIISKTYNTLTKIAVNTNVKDITTGFKLYNTKIFRKITLKSNGFGLHVEIFLKAVNKGFKAKEVPIAYIRADKASSLNYRKQFLSYALPVLHAIKEKYLR